MYDNKIRISKDVIEKAQRIADEWGLKNSRAALEAVFRKYSDEYLYGRLGGPVQYAPMLATSIAPAPPMPAVQPPPPAPKGEKPGCEAIDALDDLLAM
ncbi:MAG: hypothetical protein AAFQ61_11160 [Cyanobacteria bacterium J06626_23]